MGKYGAFINVAANFGLLLAYFLGVPLVFAKYTYSSYWRVLFVTPAVISFISLIFLYTILDNEPLNRLIS